MRNFKKAFTLIELLIVIGILAVIMVGLLVVLDPVEQAKRGADTALGSQTKEVEQAIARYYASKQALPVNFSTNLTDVALDTRATLFTATEGLVSSGELAADFTNRVGTSNMNKIRLNIQTDGTKLMACYQPASKAVRGSTARYSSDGSIISTICPNPALATCYVCF